VLCEHAAKLTLEPSAIGSADIDRLRLADLDDDAVHDLTQVIALFNLYTRLAEGLGVDLEPEW